MSDLEQVIFSFASILSANQNGNVPSPMSKTCKKKKTCGCEQVLDTNEPGYSGDMLFQALKNVCKWIVQLTMQQFTCSGVTENDSEK